MAWKGIYLKEGVTMEGNESGTGTGGLSLPRPSSSDLRGRQSVRATFRLTARAIAALSALSSHLGIKQKSLFDHLIEDAESLSLIAEAIQGDERGPSLRVQKTYVLSRRTLSCLERVSRAYDTTRDSLVEYSIKRLLPLIDQEREKQEKRRQVMDRLSRHLEEERRILAQSRESLGDDDPVCGWIEDALRALEGALTNIDGFIERGKVIEDF